MELNQSADRIFKALSKCKIGLNLSQGSAGKYYSSDRSRN